MDLATSDVLTLLLAASSDEKKNARLVELQTAQKAIEAAKAEHEERAAQNARDGAGALKMMRDAQALADSVAGRHAELDAKERNLNDVNISINAERAAWETIRATVDREQAEKRDQLESLATSLSGRETAIGEREKFVSAREQAAAEAQTKYESLLDRARLLLDLDTPMPVPKQVAKK